MPAIPASGTAESQDVSSCTVLRVQKYDPGTHATSQKRLIQATGSVDDTIGTLVDLRKFLIAEQKSSIASPFCDQQGSELSDSTSAKVYFSIVREDAKDKPQSTDAPRQLNVYYKQKKTRTELDDATKEFLKNQLDLTTKDQKLSEADVKRLKSAFDTAAWAAKGDSKLSHAADLNEEEWSVIARTNCLLSGHKIVKFEKTIGGPVPVIPDGPGYDKKSSKSKANGRRVTEYKIERTPYNAFKLKPRRFEPYEISASPYQGVISSVTPTQPGAENLVFRIPRFRVDDDSYVSVYETQSVLEKSLAKGSFSETSMEASAGGGFWGISAAAKFGGAWSNSEDSVHAESTENKSMNISYKFPRITLYLDPGSLEITEECEADIANVQTKADLLDFSEKYGDIFAQRVQLGGSLYASESSTATSSQDKEKKANAMKISAAASFSSSFFQASASFSHDSGSSSDDNKSNQDLTSAMAWEAVGGDSLLCNNPAAWCATVGDFYNWRVIEQDCVLPLSKALDAFKGNNAITEQFKQAAAK